MPLVNQPELLAPLIDSTGSLISFSESCDACCIINKGPDAVTMQFTSIPTVAGFGSGKKVIAQYEPFVIPKGAAILTMGFKCANTKTAQLEISGKQRGDVADFMREWSGLGAVLGPGGVFVPPFNPPAPVSVGTTWNNQYDISGTSGPYALTIGTPQGDFTLDTAEVDSAAVKTQNFGGLTITYSGASRGTRGIISITGTGGSGTYTFTATATGTTLYSTSVTVTGTTVTYQCAGEGFAAFTHVNAGTVLHSLDVGNSPAAFAIG